MYNKFNLITFIYMYEYGYCSTCKKWHSKYDDCTDIDLKDNTDDI